MSKLLNRIPVSGIVAILLLGIFMGRLVPAEDEANPQFGPRTISEAQPLAGNWHIETVDAGTEVGKYTSLALDEFGRPHIVYPVWDEPGGHYDLRYATHNGTDWEIEMVDGSGWSEYPSLALDTVGRPHITYYDFGSLTYAWHDGVDWHFEMVDDHGGYYTSLALGALDRPHISYQGNFDYPGDNWDLKYAWHDQEGWHIQTVDGDSEVGFDTSLALDGSGRPHISYYDYTLGDLKYAWHDGSEWHIETVDNGVSETSLALDGSNRPHISYNGPAGITHAWRDGAMWYSETVDSGGGYYTSLALDELGRPHISYRSGNALTYAWYNGAEWRIETVDSGPGIGTYTSLTLDGLGRPHISYSGDGLRYAHRSPPPLPSLAKQAMPNLGLLNGDILTYTLTLSGVNLGVRLWDPLPDSVQLVSGSITCTLTPMAVYSPTAQAIVWEGTLVSGTAHTIQFQVTPGITGTGALSPALPIVNTAWLTDSENRGISSTSIVNGRRVFLPLVARSY